MIMSLIGIVHICKGVCVWPPAYDMVLLIFFTALTEAGLRLHALQSSTISLDAVSLVMNPTQIETRNTIPQASIDCRRKMTLCDLPHECRGLRRPWKAVFPVPQEGPPSWTGTKQ
jgi:hypothetical protein